MSRRTWRRALQGMATAAAAIRSAANDELDLPRLTDDELECLVPIAGKMDTGTPLEPPEAAFMERLHRLQAAGWPDRGPILGGPA